MIFEPTRLKDAVLARAAPRRDERGLFMRTFCAEAFAAAGKAATFVQQNLSITKDRGVLRGLHYQKPPHAEVKLVQCLCGAIYDVIVDLRPESVTFRQWQSFELTGDDFLTLYVPEGFAHGFLTLCDDVAVTYLVSAPYRPAAEAGLRWNDPAFGVDWPFAPTRLSEKDRSWPDFAA